MHPATPSKNEPNPTQNYYFMAARDGDPPNEVQHPHPAVPTDHFSYATKSKHTRVVAPHFPIHHSLSDLSANAIQSARQERSRGMKALSIDPSPQQQQSSRSFDSHTSVPYRDDDDTFDTPCSNPESVRHDTSHLSALIGTLILTSALGVLSGLDARNECLKHETNALLALRESDDDVDDDGNNDDGDYADFGYEDAYDEAYLKEADHGCIKLFRRVMLPAMLVTTVAGILGLVLLRCPATSSPQSPTATSSVAPISPIEAFNQSIRLLAVATLILAAQAYNVTYIMLSPRRTDYSSSENPFQTLAAVDLLGHVSQNANLFYLSWLSVGIAVALFYQSVTSTTRAYRAVEVFRRNCALLPATSWYILSTYEDQESRHAWYQSVYRLRIRTGIWTAAFLSCMVITASSQYIWKEMLWPNFSQNNNDDGYNDNNVNGEDEFDQEQDEKESMESLRGLRFSVCQTIYVNSGEAIPVTMCRRTAMAWFAGVLAMILCAVAISIHWVSRTPTIPTPSVHINIFRNLLERHRVPLGTELGLSIAVSLLLGWNAMFATGLNGPATNVGNLYYASWASFLLLIRICLGCLEEWYQVEDGGNKHPLAASQADAAGQRHSPPVSTYLAPALSKDEEGEKRSLDENGESEPAPDGLLSESETEIGGTNSFNDQTEKDRVKRMRSYFCLSIFSTVCAASAHDAASKEESLNKVQRYILLAPVIVAAISTILFIFCLSRRCYLIASHYCVGGILAVISFGLWLADLVLTMHSEESWAVNRIGEIKMANLYYFSWASILTAGLQLSTFVKALFGITQNDTMSIVWIGICKVCFVIFGAGMHIWLNISDKCDFAELGAVTFCSRTVLAIIVSLTGMLVGGLVVVIRFFRACCKSCHSHRTQAHIEIYLSSFLLLLFAAAVALITGIGGPGQSVGDLYYSTWLSFAVSLGIFLHCYDQITQADDESKPETPQHVDEKKPPETVLA